MHHIEQGSPIISTYSGQRFMFMLDYLDVFDDLDMRLTTRCLLES